MQNCSWRLKKNTQMRNVTNYKIPLNFLVYIEPLPSSDQKGCWNLYKIADMQALAKDKTRHQMRNSGLLEGFLHVWAEI